MCTMTLPTITVRSPFNWGEFKINCNSDYSSIKDAIDNSHVGQVLKEKYYLVSGETGQLYNSESAVRSISFLSIVPRLNGGKGGFGSMLRAIGAQIEKTTNREACRDLSGRRLRDINEEKRLKKWIEEKADREKETAERKKKKLEKLLAEPKHEFSDPNYEKERSELIEKVYDAIEEGLKVASGKVLDDNNCNNCDESADGNNDNDEKNQPCSSKGVKRKAKPKGFLWDEAEFDDISDTDDSDEEESRKKLKA